MKVQKRPLSSTRARRTACFSVSSISKYISLTSCMALSSWGCRSPRPSRRDRVQEDRRRTDGKECRKWKEDSKNMGTIRSNKKKVEEQKQFEGKGHKYHSEGFRAREWTRAKEKMTSEKDTVIFFFSHSAKWTRTLIHSDQHILHSWWRTNGLQIPVLSTLTMQNEISETSKHVTVNSCKLLIVAITLREDA